jgi:hypothetical protein
LALLLLAFASPAVLAKVDLVVLHQQPDVEVTIYNPADLTIIQERRTTSLKRGANQLQFSWNGKTVDPTSVFLAINDPRVEVRDIEVPAKTQRTLIWNIHASEALSCDVEFMYFVSSLSWKADYVLTTNDDSTTSSLESYVTFTNNSGLDFKNVTARLVLGHVNLKDLIADLARKPLNGGSPSLGNIPIIVISDAENNKGTVDNNLFVFTDSFAFADFDMDGDGAELGFSVPFGRQQAIEIKKEGVGEYFLYTLDTRIDIPNKMSQRIPLQQIVEAYVETVYRHDHERYGPWIVPVLRFKNSVSNGLGTAPLPAGNYRVFHEVADTLRYRGEATEKDVPIGAWAEPFLAHDQNVMLEETVIDFQRINLQIDPAASRVEGHDELKNLRLDLQNFYPHAIDAELRIHLVGDSDFTALTPDSEWEQIDENTWEGKVQVEGGALHRQQVEVLQRIGTNAQK